LELIKSKWNEVHGCWFDVLSKKSMVW
jgi:hypothetical protein